MKIKFNLGWILAIAAAIVLAAMGFMSFYYLFSGNLIIPIIVSVCLLVLPIILNAYLVPAKECSKPFYFHKEAVKEITLLVGLVILCLVSMSLVNHFFTVNSRTGMIASTISNQRHQLDEMQQSYGSHVESRERNYRAYLQEVLDNKDRDVATYNRVFPNGSNDIELMVREMHNKISLKGLKESASAVYEGENVSWWQLPSVMNKVDDISSALEKNYNLMTERDHNFKKDEMAQDDYWTYSYTSAKDMMTNFTTSDGLISSFWSVLSVLISFFFIMLPYIAAERDSRSNGLFAELRRSEDKRDDDDLLLNANIGKL